MDEHENGADCWCEPYVIPQQARDLIVHMDQDGSLGPIDHRDYPRATGVTNE